MRLLALITILPWLSLACATQPYTGPVDAGVPTATVRASFNVGARRGPARPSQNVSLAIHTARGMCGSGEQPRFEDTYAGSVPFASKPNKFEVVGGRPVFFRVSYFEYGLAVEVRCEGTFGFEPEAGRSYDLYLHIESPGCRVRVIDEEGLTLPLLPPAGCFSDRPL